MKHYAQPFKFSKASSGLYHLRSNVRLNSIFQTPRLGGKPDVDLQVVYERELILSVEKPVEMNNPFLQSLGIELVRWAKDEAEFHMSIQPQHLNRQGKLHGGLTATLLDAACGYAGLYSGEHEEESHGVTVTLNISYLRAAREGTVIAKGQVTRSGRSLYFVQGTLVSNQGELLATAQGAFKRK